MLAGVHPFRTLVYQHGFLLNQVYCAGNSNDGGGSTVNIEGGTFINNSALELGGVIAAWGGSVVTIAGGEFIDNTAK